jgi:hypothetical protein
VRHGRSGGFLAALQRPPLPERLAGVVPPLQPGDVLLFTDLTLHRSGANTTPHARWSADWAYELLATDAICPPIEPAPVEHPSQQAPGVAPAPVEPAAVPSPAPAAAVPRVVARWWLSAGSRSPRWLPLACTLTLVAAWGGAHVLL